MKPFKSTDGQHVEFLDDRFYQVGEDTFFPSVTTILQTYPKGPAFLQWIKDVGNSAKQIAERAAESGTKVHNAAADLIAGEELIWDDHVHSFEEWNGILRFADFYTKFKPKILASEVTTISHKYKYAGTLDIVCEIDGKTYLLDIKFGNAIYDTYYFQLAAYKQSWEENGGVLIDEMGILWLKAKTRSEGKKGSMQGISWQVVKPKDSYERLLEIFLKTLDIYTYENPESKPKNLVLPAKIKLDVPKI